MVEVGYKVCVSIFFFFFKKKGHKKINSDLILDPSVVIGMYSKEEYWRTIVWQNMSR